MVSHVDTRCEGLHMAPGKSETSDHSVLQAVLLHNIKTFAHNAIC